MNNALMNAIFAMDAYNRGYDASIELPTIEGVSEIGNATIITTSSSALKDENGNVNIDDDIGFYAIAYDTNNDGKGDIIAYRGTDYPQIDTTIPRDMYHGWTLGGGMLSSEQGHMAVEFYQEVAGEGNHFSTDITLTGHSLGGGLAGFVAENDNVFIEQIIVA